MASVLISGASTGIGRASALRLARAGWTVFAGVRDLEAGKGLVDEAAAGDRVVPVALDITDPEQIAAVAALIEERVGPAGLDGLVNNAGIGHGGPLELLPIEDLREQLEVNVIGHVAVMQAVLPSLRRARGRILFLSSVGGRVSTPFTSPYHASKYAIEAIADSLRGELHSSHIQVALIEPGSVATPIWDKSRDAADRVSVPPELQKEYGPAIPAMRKTLESTAKRGVPPEKVAEVIERALGADRMQARYLIGRDAHAMVWMKRLLPDLVLDRILRRAIGI